MTKIPAYVFSGGGIRAVCMLGATHWYDTKGELTNASPLIGTSAGAIIAYLLSIGYSPSEILHEAVNLDLAKRMTPNLQTLLDARQMSVFQWSVIDAILHELTIRKIGKIPTLRELPRLTIVTYNFTHNRVEYLNFETASELSALDALRMSCAIPIVFPRVLYTLNEEEGISQYVDGGFGDNLALSYAEERYPDHQIIAFKMDYLETKSEPVTTHVNVPNYLLRVLTCSMVQIVEKQVSSRREDSIVITLKTRVIRAFEFNLGLSEILSIASHGYREIVKLREPERLAKEDSSDIGPDTE